MYSGRQPLEPQDLDRMVSRWTRIRTALETMRHRIIMALWRKTRPYHVAVPTRHLYAIDEACFFYLAHHTDVTDPTRQAIGDLYEDLAYLFFRVGEPQPPHDTDTEES